MVMHPSTYLFYDIETTGLDKAFDQVLQFAAIRTDPELNEIARYQFYVKLSVDIIPSPSAAVTHRISLAKAQLGLTELEAIQKIHDLMNQAATISCGYNTLGFDDEFLRFSFYRHLLPPYTHQYLNNCGRMDLYPITVMYYLYNSSIIKWPDNQGKPSMKLADINAANQFFPGSAHDAMVDVEVTLALARRLRKKIKIWDYAVGYFNKDRDKYRLGKLVNNQWLLIDGKFGADSYYQWPVMYLGEHNVYKNQRIFLRLDVESVAEGTWIFRKKLGELGLLLPMTGHYIEKLKAERLSLVERNLKWLQDNPGELKKIERYHKSYVYPLIDNLDVDAALYAGGFLSREEEQLSQQFHRVGAHEKAKLIDLFNNQNLCARAIRLMGRYYPDYLPEKFQAAFDAYLSRIGCDAEKPIINYKGERKLTAQEGLSKIKELRQQQDFPLDAEQKKLLRELENYCKTRLPTSGLLMDDKNKTQ